MKILSVALCASALLGVASTAMAADMRLPVKAPAQMTTRAPMPMFYVGAGAGWANASSSRTMTSVTSIGAEPISTAPFSSSGSSLIGGAFVGINLPPLGGALPFYFGAELGIDLLNASSSLVGTPILPAGPAFPSATDAYRFRDNYMVTLSALLHVQVAQFDIFGRVGGAWVNKTITFDCVSLCVAAGTAAFSGTRDTTLGGWILGVGVQTPLPIGSLPMLIRVEYDHVFLGSTSASFAAAAPATTAVAFNVSQDIDIVRASLVLPLFSR